MSIDLTPSRVEEQAPAGHAVVRVPWRAVLPLAVVLALADLFWIGSLRVTVGHISRNQSPFESWVRESALSLPLFVLAVLGALTVALHWFGTSPRGARQVLATIGLVTAAATTAGMAALAASTYYDYLLESDGERAMGAMRQSCTGRCANLAQEATLRLQLQSFGVGTLLILVTNLVLVAWVVAALGGRLQDRHDQARPVPRGRPHPAHRRAGRQCRHPCRGRARAPGRVVRGRVVLRAPHRGRARRRRLALPRCQAPALLAAAAVSAGPLLRGCGRALPACPSARSPVSRRRSAWPTVAACVLEVLTLVLALVPPAAGPGRQAHRRAAIPLGEPHGARLALVAIVAVTAVGLAGTPAQPGSASSSRAAHTPSHDRRSRRRVLVGTRVLDRLDVAEHVDVGELRHERVGDVLDQVVATLHGPPAGHEQVELHEPPVAGLPGEQAGAK